MPVKIKKEGANEPKLRFPEFKGPWNLVPLSTFGRAITGLTYSPSDIDPHGVLVLRSSNIKNRKLVFDDNTYVRVSAEKYHPVQEGDILICVRNGSRSLIGKNALIDNTTEGSAFGAFMTVFRSQEYRYLFQYFDSARYKWEVHKNLGATINSINGSDLKKFLVPSSSFGERSKIGEFLNLIDQWISNIESQQATLTDYKKGVIQQVFNQEKVSLKPYREWERLRLGDIADFIKGKGMSRQDVQREGVNKCIRYGELYTAYGEVIHEVKSMTNRSRQESVESEAGDVLIPASGETPIDIARATCIQESGVLLGADMNILRFRSGYSGVFFAYCLSHQYKNAIARLAQGETIAHLYPSQLKKLEVDIPSYEQQVEIANLLLSIDVLIVNKKKEVDLARLWKRGLMQQLFI